MTIVYLVLGTCVSMSSKMFRLRVQVTDIQFSDRENRVSQPKKVQKLKGRDVSEGVVHIISPLDRFFWTSTIDNG